MFIKRISRTRRREGHDEERVKEGAVRLEIGSEN